MNVLLKSASIVDPQSPFNGKKLDILIEKGIIKKIGKSLSAEGNTKEINLPNLHVSPGWFDSSVSFGEPGFEERETIENGLETAAKSGFTGIAIHPNTHPVADNSGAIAYTKSKSFTHATQLFPIGSLTIQSKGIDLAELYDMHKHKAASFGDYKKPVANPNLLKLALQYTQSFDGLVQSYPQNNDIAGKGMVNEEISSTQLGLKGIPNLAEELQITRDLCILEYTGGKLHIPTISTAKSVALIKDAKKKGLDVSCSVAVHNLILDDSLLIEFDTNYKVQPPLRTKKDIKALLKGIKDGTIDMITSDHCPMDIENKQMEFDNANYGTIGLESAFGALVNELPLEVIIEKLTLGRMRFTNETISITEGTEANISLFNPDTEYLFEKKDILSTSKNAIFLDKKLQGKAYGVYANKQLVVQ